MAVTFELIFRDRVKVIPKITLRDGTEVTDYADSMVMEVKGTEGEHNFTVAEDINFAPPSEKTAADFVEWSTLSASQPTFLQPLMDSWSGSVTADIVTKITARSNAPTGEIDPWLTSTVVPAWVSTS